MINLWRWCLKLVMASRLYRWTLRAIIPYIRFSVYYTAFKGVKYHEGYSRLKSGHIILTDDHKKLTSLLIPGMMSHAALCVGRLDEGDEYEVAEMTHSNFTKSTFFDLCKEAERVVILECPDWIAEPIYLDAVIWGAKSFEGVEYDQQFTLGVEALYCSELIYEADLFASTATQIPPKLQCDLTDLAGLGQQYLSPDGLLFTKNLVCVWDSSGEWAGLPGAHIEIKCHQKKAKGLTCALL